MPDWFHILSIVALGLGVACALVIAADERRDPQQMWIMNVVWPVVALFGTVIAAWAYFRYGRLASHAAAESAARRGVGPSSKKETPFPVMVGKAADRDVGGISHQLSRELLVRNGMKERM